MRKYQGESKECNFENPSIRSLVKKRGAGGAMLAATMLPIAIQGIQAAVDHAKQNRVKRRINRYEREIGEANDSGLGFGYLMGKHAKHPGRYQKRLTKYGLADDAFMSGRGGYNTYPPYRKGGHVKKK